MQKKQKEKVIYFMKQIRAALFSSLKQYYSKGSRSSLVNGKTSNVVLDSDQSLPWLVTH